MHSIRRLKMVTASLSVMLLLAAVVANSASAAEARWSWSGEAEIAGNVTLKLNGGTPVECAGLNITGNAGGTYLLSKAEPKTCSGSPFLLQFLSEASVEGSSYSITNRGSGNTATSPYGTYVRAVWTAPFINGSASTPSQLVFNNTVIGRRQSDHLPITLTGTMSVTRFPGGGLITLK